MYSNGPALWVDRCDAGAIAKRSERDRSNEGRKPAAAFLVKDVGLFIAGTDKIAQTIRDIVAVLARSFARTHAGWAGFGR